MTYRTCNGCVHGTGFCQAREDVKARVKGIGVTSLKWKCKHRRPIYQPGDAVWVNLFVGYEERCENWGGEEAVFASFPGTVIRMAGSKAVIFVEPGVASDCEEYSFEPQNAGSGYVKITLTRTRRRDAIREHVCDCCGNIPRLRGHVDGYRCAPFKEGTYY